MKKFLIVSIIPFFLLFSKGHANQGWGMSQLTCSEILEKRGPEYWDEWLLIHSQGLLTGLNVWHLRKYGTTKNLGRYDADFLIAYIYSECKRNKNKIMGLVVQEYLFNLPNN